MNRTEQPKEEFEKVEKPITTFSMLHSSVMQKVLPPEEKKILKYLHLMKELMRNSEINGTLGVKSHAALFKGSYLPFITVQNTLKTGTKYSNKIELGCYSNTTIWELKKLIGEHCSRIYN